MNYDSSKVIKMAMPSEKKEICQEKYPAVMRWDNWFSISSTHYVIAQIPDFIPPNNKGHQISKRHIISKTYQKLLFILPFSIIDSQFFF